MRAQNPDSSLGPTLRSLPLVTLGGTADERSRLAQLLGRGSTDGYLIRSPSSLAVPTAESGSWQWRWIPPVLTLVHNSALPFSLNDGALWAGRGWSTRVTAGFRAAYGPVTLTFAPELVRVQNTGFPIIPYETPDRSSFVPSWYTGPISADLPLRFGNQPFTQFIPGQSTLALRIRKTVVGASSENQWWGPGIRNAIVMSNNAAGIPHLFLRTASPLRTRLGTLEAKWMVGGLTESLYFDTDSDNDIRSISALAVTFRPAAEPDLTLGLTRAVYAAVDGGGEVPGRALDVFTRWERPLPPGEDAVGEKPEQIFSLFGRWIFPASGLELYGEWARLELPGSLRDLLAAPNHTQGYTLGLQWARPLVDTARIFRLQTELTYLEQSATFRVRPTPSFYTSRSVLQGYTQRGQSIGATIGPGASSQWVAADFFAPRWQVGAFAGRIRWENDAYYRQYTGFSFLAHDVSLLGGIRAGGHLPGAEISAELTRAKRYNYLFQNSLIDFSEPGVDIWNTTFKLVITPFIAGRQ